jgi:hypothetical protein
MICSDFWDDFVSLDHTITRFINAVVPLAWRKLLILRNIGGRVRKGAGLGPTGSRVFPFRPQAGTEVNGSHRARNDGSCRIRHLEGMRPRPTCLLRRRRATVYGSLNRLPLMLNNEVWQALQAGRGLITVQRFLGFLASKKVDPLRFPATHSRIS